MRGFQLLTGITFLVFTATAVKDIEEINKDVTDPDLILDMVISAKDRQHFFGIDPNPGAFDPMRQSSPHEAATTITSRLWSLPIPYVIHWSIDFSTRFYIKQAIREFARKTCVKFREKSSTDKDYIVFVGNRIGCYSYIGKIKGSQIVSLGDGCGVKRTVVHEIMHALGFLHEQSRSDRDEHVEIQWKNIKDGKSSQFHKASSVLYGDLGVDYDYESVLHYKRHAFSRNNEPTIIRRDGIEDEFGQRPGGGLSPKDEQQVDALYRCNEIGEWSSWGSYGDCSENCGGGYRSRYRSCFGGICSGENKQSEDCNTQACRGWGCFPSDAIVTNDKGVKVSMKDLKIGEKVLAMDSNGRPIYSPITMMLHRETNRTTKNFVAIVTDDGSSITMTLYHLIPLSTKEFVFAKDVKPGQHITVFDEAKNGFHSKQVVSVDAVTKTGLYAPLSNEGTMVVNDVHVSCYALFRSHSISHFVFSIWRSLYANFESILSQRTDADGVHWYPSMLKTTATYLNIL